MRLEAIRSRERRRIFLKKQARAIEDQIAAIAEIAIHDPLGEPRYSLKVSELRREAGQLYAEISLIDKALDTQNVPLIEMMGEVFHDALREHIPSIGRLTRIAEIPSSFRGHTWRYLIPSKTPIENIPPIDLRKATFTESSIELQQFVIPPDGPAADVGYAPDIDTLFLRRLT